MSLDAVSVCTSSPDVSGREVCGISGFTGGRGGGGVYTGLDGGWSPRYAASFEFAVVLAETAAASALARSSAKEGITENARMRRFTNSWALVGNKSSRASNL